MKVDIPGVLRSLRQVVDRIAELIEWEKLARQERRPGVPPSFQLPDHFWEDVESMHAWFWNLDSSIHEVLDRTDLDITEERRKQWVPQLQDLEDRADNLEYTARLIKP